MEGKYVVPKEILKLKPRGTIVKNINGYYYVHETKCVYDNQKKRGKTVNGPCIGKITLKDGFVSNKSKLRKSYISVLDYGSYYFVDSIAQDILKDLNESFHKDDAKRIYILALTNAVDGLLHLNQYKKIYDYSFLSLKYEKVYLSENTTAQFLEDLGCRTTSINNYFIKKLERSSKLLALDSHVMGTYSTQNNLAKYGSKYTKLDSTQYNLLTLIDIKTMEPLMYRVYPGNQVDKMTVKDFFEHLEVKDAIFIMDSGFYTEDNIKIFSLNNLYIIPLTMNLAIYKKATKTLNYTNIFFYEKQRKKNIIKSFEIISNNQRICIFKNSDLALEEEKTYLECLERGQEGFSLEDLEIKKDLLGVIVLSTNSNLKLEDIYRCYKSRWNIETYFGVFKNELNFKALGLHDYNKTNGFIFILNLATSIRFKIKEFIKKHHKKTINSKSVSQLIFDLKYLKLIYYKNQWKVQNATIDETQYYNDLGINLTYTT